MLWSLLFMSLFSLFIPDLKDNYPILGIYHEVYKDIKRELDINQSDKKALNKKFDGIKKDTFRHIKKILNN